MDPLTLIINALAGKKVVDAASKNEAVQTTVRDAKAGAEMLGQGISDTAKSATNFVGETAGKVGDKASKVLEDAKNAGQNAFNGALDSYFKLFGLGYKDGKVYSPEVERAINNLAEKAKKNKADTKTLGEVTGILEQVNKLNEQQEKPAEPAEPVVDEEEDDEVVTYTYKPGDTFGQVLLNLGLSDGTNLWGQGGDVDFYTQQLREQNALNSMGNIPIGTTIRLRRRK